MCRSIGMLAALAAVLGFVPLVQAAVLYDFESPTYTVDTSLNDQDGWISAGYSSIPDPQVVAKPTAMPSSAGEQSAQIGFYTDHHLDGAGWTDVSTASWLLQYTPGGGYVVFDLIGTNRFTRAKIDGNNVISYWHTNDSGQSQLVDLDSTDTKVWQVTETINFTTKQYKTVWTDLSTSTSYDTGFVALLNGATASRADAEANGYFSACNYSGGTGGHYMDNVSIVPEPSSLTLLAIGLLCYAWRKRK